MAVKPTRAQESEPLATERRSDPIDTAPAHPPALSRVLELQRTVGNAAVGRLLDDARPQPAAPGRGDAAAAAVGLRDAAPATNDGATAAGPDGAASGVGPEATEDARAAAGPDGDRARADDAVEEAEAGARPGPDAGQDARAGATPGAGAEGARVGAAPRPAPAAAAVAAPAADTGAERSAAEAPAGAAPAGGRAAGPSARDPHADPEFQALKGRVGAVAAGQKAHQPAKTGAAAAQAAALPPGNDLASQAAGAQIEEMGEQKPGTFDRAAFVAAVQKAVDAAAPKNLSEASNFKESGKAAKIKGQVGGLVKGGKQESERDIKQATQAPPDPGRAKPKPVTPLAGPQPGPPPAGVAAADAMPAPRPPEETDLSEGHARVDAKMAEAELTEEQLAESNEPDFTAVLEARREAREHAEAAPGGFRAQEQDVLTAGQDEAESAAAEGVGGMRGAKLAALAKAMSHQSATKGADEGKRAQVATAVQEICGRTKTDVTQILADLDPKVDKEFTKGEDAARQQFEGYVGDQMRAYKKKRYSGWRGKLRWVRDKFAGLPDAVNVFYDTGRGAYLKAMEAVIGRVADIVGTELEAARARIAAGRAEVRKYVTELPKDLKEIGKQAEDKLDSQFEELTTDVDSKQDELVETVAQKYVAARDQLDARIEELQADNRGLVEKAVDFAVGVAKTVWKLKDMLFSILAKAAGVIADIIAHPIRFLGNLVEGIGSGLRNFKDNIVGHLENAFSKWLFGTLGKAGITPPDNLDFAGILDLATQILDLGYDKLRARLVKHTSEEAVARMEKSVDIFKALKAKGVGGIWEAVKEKVSNLESLVLGKIKDFVVERVIKGGIAWILSLLTPASAFIKACKAIYDIIMFVVERAAEIKEFINSVLDSIGDIARGNVAGAAAKVETALANALPLAISFLARLLNLGGISERIQSVVAAVRAPITKAIDSVVLGALKLYKRTVGGAVGWAKGKVEQSKRWAKGKAAAVRDGLTGAPDEAEVAEPDAEEETEQEREAPASDPRVEAGALLVNRLNGKTELHHVEEEIANVRAELAPRGLRTLHLGPQSEDGSHPIVATASPPLVTARTVAIERADVVMHVQIGLTEAGRGTALKDKTFHDAGGGRRIADVTEREGVAHASSGAGAEPDKTGGATMLEPERGATHLEVVTFSGAGGRRTKDNPSHAEHQFMTFFEQRVPDVSQVTSISITLSHSPCSLCAQEAQRNLAGFARMGRGDEPSLKQLKDKGKLTLELKYDQIHTGTNPTRPADIAALRSAGWAVSGNQDFGRHDEIVTVEAVVGADPGKDYRGRTAREEREQAERAAKAKAKAEAKAAKAKARADAKAERARRRKERV